MPTVPSSPAATSTGRQGVWPGRDFQERLVDRNGRALSPISCVTPLDRRLAINVRSKRIEIGLVGDDVLAALRQHVVEEELAGVRILGVLGNEGDARGHHRVVLRQNDAEVRVLLRPAERVGAENPIGDQVLARRDALHHGAGAGVELGLRLAHRLEEVPGLREILDVRVAEQIADAGALGIVRSDLAFVEIRLGVEQLQKIGVILRHVPFGNEAFVVDKGDGLIGGAVGRILPHRPFRQRLDLRRGVGRGVTVGDKLHLQIHRRRPNDVRGAVVGRSLGDEAVIELGGIEVGVFDLDAGVERLEVFDQRIGGDCVGGRRR